VAQENLFLPQRLTERFEELVKLEGAARKRGTRLRNNCVWPNVKITGEKEEESIL